VEDILFGVLAKFSYIGLFAILLAAGLGVPLPEDIPLVAAGWLVHKGGADLMGMIATGLVGVLVGDSLLFSMGRRYGTRIVEHRWLRRIAKPWLLERARYLFTHHGTKMLFAARFMPGLRAVMFLTAGVFKVSYVRFLAIDGFAALISVPVWVWAGWKFSSEIERILGGARIATYVVVGVLLLGLALWIVWEYRHNLRKRAAAPQEQVIEEIVRSAPLASHDAPAERHAHAASPAQAD
jgi:membrane protein DedA with SNARE-associated domain